ncbi:MAG: hypothetical protein V1737_04530 [Chloroflexota bacterium]
MTGAARRCSLASMPAPGSSQVYRRPLGLPTRQATLKGNPLTQTPTQYRLLTHLARSAGRVLTPSHLLHAVSSNSCHLRHKLVRAGPGPDAISAELDMGYRLNPPA